MSTLQCPGLYWHIEHEVTLAVSLTAGTAQGASHRENMFSRDVLWRQTELRNTFSLTLCRSDGQRFYRNKCVTESVCSCCLFIKGTFSADQSLSVSLVSVVSYPIIAEIKAQEPMTFHCRQNSKFSGIFQNILLISEIYCTGKHK